MTCVAMKRVGREAGQPWNRWITGNQTVYYRTYSRFAPSQWETALLCNDVFHWLGASLESTQHCIMTLKREPRHINWPASRMFVHQFVQAGIKGNTLSPHHCRFVSGIHRYIPSQKASNAESVFISWRHKEIVSYITCQDISPARVPGGTSKKYYMYDHDHPPPWPPTIITLDHERCGNNFKSIIFKLIIQNSSLATHCEIVPRWMQWDIANEKSTLVRVMVWCRQAPSHYLRQWWPGSMSLFGLTRPQWVKCQLLPQSSYTIGGRGPMLLHPVLAWWRH